MRIDCGRAAEVTENCELYLVAIGSIGSSNHIVNAPQVVVTNIAGWFGAQVLRYLVKNVEGNCLFMFWI